MLYTYSKVGIEERKIAFGDGNTLRWFFLQLWKKRIHRNDLGIKNS